MSGAMAQQRAPPPSLAPESSAMAAEADYEQVRHSLLLAGVTHRYVHIWIGGNIGCTQPVQTVYLMYDLNFVK